MGRARAHLHCAHSLGALPDPSWTAGDPGREEIEETYDNPQ
jgi:hypothetical protein